MVLNQIRIPRYQIRINPNFLQNSSMFTSVASNMNQNHTAEELFAMIPEFAEALAKRDLDLALSR